MVEYDDLEDLFLRTEPTMRAIEFGKKGDLGMVFSSNMIYPDAWTEKMASDTAILAAEANGTLVGRRRLQTIDQIKFFVLKPNKNLPEEVSSDDLVITSLDPRKLGMKLKFARPDLVSLTS